MIRILNREYTLVKQDVDPTTTNCAARCLTQDGKIIINNHPYDASFLKDSILHEVLHAINYEFGMELTDEENTINRLTKALIRVFLDNPKLISILTAETLDWKEL